MSTLDILEERALQRAAHVILSDPNRTWRCTNGDAVQIVAAGVVNPHEGPDFSDMAVLHRGTVHVGNGEFHRRSSDFYAHDHAHDVRYASLLVHVVLEDDVPVGTARWTVVMSAADMWRGIRLRSEARVVPSELAVDEVQHFALLRLLRTSAEAHVHVRRVGTRRAIQAMAAQWIERLMAKRHRPIDDGWARAVIARLPASPLGRVADEFAHCAIDEILPAMAHAERERVASEGPAMRRELLVNVILPVCLSIAGAEQRIVLFQWYWSVRAVHPYAMLRRRYPTIPQEYVWQQQGMLEFHRDHHRYHTVCAEAIRAYGFGDTLEFLRVSEGSVSL